ncbi:MAG: hypothetical protein U9Q07_07275 [Planctomycetota bacterium]|nr:hypothetical protein [Planctomycetota bacterium]
MRKLSRLFVLLTLITGTYHFMAIFVQQELFPPEPERKKPAGGNSQN